MNFIGREREIGELQAFAEKPGFGAALIYGRRRVGKTSLINRCLADWKGKGRIVAFTGARSSLQANLGNLKRSIAEAFPETSGFSFEDLDAAMGYLFEAAKKEKVIVVLDEYPYLRSFCPEIDDILLRYSDRYQERNLKLILSGSTVGTMVGLNDRDSVLHGRFRLIMNVEAFDYFEAAKFVPGYSDDDKFRTYAVFGGIPYFLSFLDDSLTLRENIERLFISTSSPLEPEINYSLIGEMRKVDNASLLLDLIARGYRRYTDLKKHYASSGLKANGFDNVIQKLTEASFIEKTYPINFPNDPSKSSYRLTDNALLFYYSLIDGNQSRNFLSPAACYDRMEDIIEKRYLPLLFEKVSREFLARLSRKGLRLPPFANIGTYYYDLPSEHRNGQFDVAAVDEGGYVLFECKYASRPVGMDVIKEEESQAALSGLAPHRLGFIARNGFATEVDPAKYELYELADFFDERLQIP